MPNVDFDKQGIEKRFEMEKNLFCYFQELSIKSPASEVVREILEDAILVATMQNPTDLTWKELLDTAKKFPGNEPIKNEILNRPTDNSLQDIKATFENLQCVQMSQKSNLITNLALEVEIKKLIDEIRTLDFTDSKSENETIAVVKEGQGDAEGLVGKETLESVNSDVICQNDSDIFSLDENTSDCSSEMQTQRLVEKKSCRTDLLSKTVEKNDETKEEDDEDDENREFMTDNQVWEENEEEMVKVIEPEYSDDEGKIEKVQLLPIDPGKLYNVDLNIGEQACSNRATIVEEECEDAEDEEKREDKDVFIGDGPTEGKILGNSKAEMKTSGVAKDGKKGNKKKFSFNWKFLNFFSKGQTKHSNNTELDK